MLMFRKIYTALLQSSFGEQTEVKTFSNGEDALHELNSTVTDDGSWSYDLMLIDQSMGPDKMLGSDVHKVIRDVEASRPSSARKLLLVSATATKDEYGHLVASGANLALEKGEQTADLIAKLQRLIVEMG